MCLKDTNFTSRDNGSRDSLLKVNSPPCPTSILINLNRSERNKRKRRCINCEKSKNNFERRDKNE